MAIQGKVSPVMGGSGRTRKSPLASLILTQNVVVRGLSTTSMGGMLKIETVTLIRIEKNPA